MADERHEPGGMPQPFRQAPALAKMLQENASFAKALQRDAGLGKILEQTSSFQKAMADVPVFRPSFGDVAKSVLKQQSDLREFVRPPTVSADWLKWDAERQPLPSIRAGPSRRWRRRSASFAARATGHRGRS